MQLTLQDSVACCIIGVKLPHVVLVASAFWRERQQIQLCSRMKASGISLRQI